MRLIKEGLTAATSTSPHPCLVPGDLFITLNSTVTTQQPGHMRMEHSSFSAWSTQHCFNSPLDLLLTTSTCSAILTFRVWYSLKYHQFVHVIPVTIYLERSLFFCQASNCRIAVVKVFFSQAPLSEPSCLVASRLRPCMTAPWDDKKNWKSPVFWANMP